MSQTYTNIPSEKTDSSSNQTLEVFDQNYATPIVINNNDLIIFKGFFEKRGFDPVAAENTAITILKQAKKDGYKALEILDTLKGLSAVELNGLITEIVNYNRFKTSLIGTAQVISPLEEINRNILL